MNQQVFGNGTAGIALVEAMTSAIALSLKVSIADAAKLPALTNGDFLMLTLTSATQPGAYEVAKATAVDAATGIVTLSLRAVEGTAMAWGVGDTAEVRLTAKFLNELPTPAALKLKATARAVTRGLIKMHGSGAHLVEGQGVSRTIFKIRAPAAFDRVRIWALNRSPREANVRFAVAATEQPLNDTIANAYHPRSGGASFNVAQSEAAPIGWRTGKHGGAEGADLLPNQGLRGTYITSYQAIPDIAVSDWIDCASLPALDGLGPCLLVRYQVNSASIAGAEITNGGSTINGSTTFGNGNDIVSDLTNVPSAVPGTTKFNIPGFCIEFDFRVKANSLAVVGDSNSEGYVWQYAAWNEMSTPERPYVSANFGMSTHREIEYMANFRQFLKRGYRPTHVLFPSFSHNDFQTIPNKVGFDRMRNRILQTLELCDSINAKPICWTHFRGTNTGVGPNDSTAIEFNQWVRNLAATTGRFTVVDVAKDWNSATMVANDKTHFNEVGAAKAKGDFKDVLMMMMKEAA